MSQSNEPGVQPAAPSAPAGASQEEGERRMERREEHHPAWRARAEETMERDAEKARGMLTRHPSVPVVVLGGLAVLAADAVGVGELAMGLAVGYAAYRFFRREKGARAPAGAEPGARGGGEQPRAE